VLDYAKHALSAGGDVRAAAYLEVTIGDRTLRALVSTRTS